VVQLLDAWLKSAVLEIQDYVRLQIHTVGGPSPVPFYFRDVVEQFEEIGVGSLTVVLLTGSLPEPCSRLQTGITLDQFGARRLWVA
jgi:ABC-type transporter Mla maintaining outer membrane lipid asymmetry permease subunit MlaE